MSNTLIQIKRSTTTAAPTTLYIGEQAYSYNSDKLFIGNTTGDGVIEIGGKYFVDHLNAAWQFANTINSDISSVGTSANNFAGTMANSANAYTAATYLPLSGGTLTGDLTVSANLTVTGTTTYVNTQSLLVSDNIFVLNSDLPSGTAPSQDAGMEINRGSSANVFVIWDEDTDHWQFTNDGTTFVNIVGNTELQSVATAVNAHAVAVGTAGNTYAASVGTAANLYSDGVGTSANVYAASVGLGANAYAASVGTSANVYADGVGTSANAYADAVGTAANTNAANASYISTGTLAVSYGGTGNTSLTDNGVLVGRGTSAVSTVYSSTEGNILQINSSGVPQFGFLDGGAF